jgi:hypothetical protein
MADDLQLAEATQPLSFAEFLERMKDARAADLVKSIKMWVYGTGLLRLKLAFFQMLQPVGCTPCGHDRT